MKFRSRRPFLIGLVLSFAILCGCTESYPPVEALYLDLQAKKDIQKEEYENALAKYYRLLENLPYSPSIHSNIGVLLGGMQQPEEERKSLLYALEIAKKIDSKRDLFAIYFNLGAHYGKSKKITEALDYYQQALEIKPDSVEVKTNIELLMQQQNQSGQGESKSSSDKQQGAESQKNDQDDNKDGDQNKQDQSGQNQDQKDQNEEKKDDGKRDSSAKYKPRPYQGDQLSEGDVKKILGELSNQEQRIRANFDKKEKGKSYKNEKDW